MKFNIDWNTMNSSTNLVRRTVMLQVLSITLIYTFFTFNSENSLSIKWKSDKSHIHSAGNRNKQRYGEGNEDSGVVRTVCD